MPRGQAAQIGDRFTNANGYIYEKVERGFVGLNVLMMERHLERRLEPHEFVKFINGKHAPEDYNLDNLELRTRGDSKSPQARLAVIEDRIEQLQLEAETLRKEISRS